MSSDDITKDFPGVAETQPMLNAILERINAVGNDLTLRITEVAKNVSGLSERVDDLQKQVETGFAKLESDIGALRSDLRKLDRKIEILNDNILSVQADHRDLLERVESLERKAS